MRGFLAGFPMVDFQVDVFDGQGLGDIVLHPKLRLSNASRNKIGLSIIRWMVA